MSLTFVSSAVEYNHTHLQSPLPLVLLVYVPQGTLWPGEGLAKRHLGFVKVGLLARGTGTCAETFDSADFLFLLLQHLACGMDLGTRIQGGRVYLVIHG